jgi:hypothetical protein
MVDAKQLKAVVKAMAAGCDGETRRAAERQLETWIQELLDVKVRHSLSATTGLSDLSRCAQRATAAQR